MPRRFFLIVELTEISRPGIEAIDSEKRETYNLKKSVTHEQRDESSIDMQADASEESMDGVTHEQMDESSIDMQANASEESMDSDDELPTLSELIGLKESDNERKEESAYGRRREVADDQDEKIHYGDYWDNRDNGKLYLGR